MLCLSLFLAALSYVAAHVELEYPLPFRSRHNKDIGWGDIDYSMTNPLAADGSDYPCKGYHRELASTPISATLVAGQDFDVRFWDWAATHNGGSCEFSVSYDDGENFAVIARVVGGCPKALKYTIQIPSNLPAADKAIFSWSWSNLSGNRELYQNCVPVRIQNSRKVRSYTAPTMFRANTWPDGTCINKEGASVQYAHVDAVKTEYNDGMSSSSEVSHIENCPRELSQLITVTSDGGSRNADTDEEAPEEEEEPTSTQVATRPSSTRRPGRKCRAKHQRRRVDNVAHDRPARRAS